MPAGDLGDLLLADRASAGLLLPQMPKPSFPSECRRHVQIKSFLKVRFPSRIVWVGLCTDFRVSLDADGRSRQEPYRTHLPAFFLEHACEHPMIQSNLTKVFRFYPTARFVAVSAACPGPKCLEDSMVYIVKDLFTDHMAMIQSPSSYLRVEV